MPLYGSENQPTSAVERQPGIKPYLLSKWEQRFRQTDEKAYPGSGKLMKLDEVLHPNLQQRDFWAGAPTEKQQVDNPFILTDEGWLYLAAILDRSARKVIG